MAIAARNVEGDVAETLDAPAREMLALQEALSGRYAVERELGRGGMGIVFLARDLTLERLVAIKLLPPSLAVVPDLRERFLREARTAAGLSHPNIVPIYAVEEQHGLVYYAMGYVEGETLTERVQRVGPLPPSEAGRVLQEAAWALSYAHGRGVVHRDVKPDNVLVERATGRALLLDFGIARSRAASPLTMVGESLGTPQYMSPEQAAGESLDGRSDLYALGAVGFYMLTGQPPFDGPSMRAILAMHLTRPAPPVASLRAGIPPRLAAIVDRCLAKEPAERFASGEALVGALQAAQVPAAEVAPEVRSFQRAAELTTVQVMTLALVLLTLAELRFPSGGKVLIILALFVTVAATQLATRARVLLQRGFGYEDVRAVFEAEPRERGATESDAAVAPGSTGGRRIRRAILGLGIACIVAGLAIGIPSTHGSAQNHAGWILLYVGVGIVGVSIASSAVQRPEFAQRSQRLIGYLWTGPFGRALFSIAGTGLAARAPVVRVAADEGEGCVSALLNSLPADVRTRLDGAADVVMHLELAAREQTRREQDLEQAALDALSGPEISATDAATSLALAGGQAQLVAEIQKAREAAAVRRGAIIAALESVRLQLLRARSGLGTTDQVLSELSVARAALQHVNEGDSAPGKLATGVS